MKRAVLCGLLVIAAAAALLRGGDLAYRPLHNDEAINAFKLEKLWTSGEYRYDPHEYHGPALYYLALPILGIASWTRPDQPDEIAMRTVAVVCGVGLILVLGLVVDGIGRGPAMAAGILIAVSPAMVFYSRYFIHEMLLVLATAVALGALWRYSRKPHVGWAIVAGSAVGLMFATKETFVFAIAAAGAAWLLTVATTAAVRSDSADGGVRRGGWRELRRVFAGLSPSHGLAALATGVAVWLLFFSSFFTNVAGLLDSFQTYAIWLDRAEGQSPHVHSWYFYLQRLAWFRVQHGPLWSEGAVLLLAILGGFVVFRRSRFTPEVRLLCRFVTFYTVVLALEYSVIPYKTPWCLLGFYHGAMVLAGIGAWTLVTLSRRAWVRVGTSLVLTAAVAHLAWQSVRANGPFAADFRNPYVYGHTSADIANLLELMEGLAEAHPEGKAMPIQVMAPGDQYWPLPWYWRRFERVGWWDRIPNEPHAPVMVAASKLGANFEEATSQAWIQVGMFEMRPRFFVEVYVERGLWQRYLEARRARDGDG